MTHLPTARLALAALTLPALLASCGGGSSSSSTTPTVVTGTTTTSDDPTVVPTTKELELLNLINTARASVQYCKSDGDPLFPAGNYGPSKPLVWSAALMRAARSYSGYLAAHQITPNVLDHGLDGLDFAVRNENFGYKNWTKTGENLAENYDNSSSNLELVVKAWLNSSEGHCQNLMNPNFTETGLGYNEAVLTTPANTTLNPNPYGLSGTTTTTYSYWVQEFGAR